MWSHSKPWRNPRTAAENKARFKALIAQTHQVRYHRRVTGRRVRAGVYYDPREDSYYANHDNQESELGRADTA